MSKKQQLEALIEATKVEQKLEEKKLKVQEVKAKKELTEAKTEEVERASHAISMAFLKIVLVVTIILSLIYWARG